jgi:hypothetical protein
MNPSQRLINALLFSSVCFLGCKPAPLPEPAPRTYDLAALDRARLEELEAENEQVPASHAQTNNNTQAGATNPPLSLISATTNHPFCYHTNHADIAHRLREATIGYCMLSNQFRQVQASNRTLRSEGTNLSYKVIAAQERTRRAEAQYDEQAKRIKDLSALNARLRETNEHLHREGEQARTKLATFEETAQKQRKEGEDYARYVRQRGEELTQIQKLLSVPGYLIPGTPLVTAQVRGTQLTGVTTHHFSFPSLITALPQLEQIITNLAPLYNQTATKNTFAEWAGHADIPLTRFPGYATKKEAYDTFGELAVRYGNATRTLTPGVVFYVDKKGTTNILAPKEAFDAWRDKQ